MSGEVKMVASVKKQDDGTYTAVVELLDGSDGDDVRIVLGAIGKGLSPTFAVQDAMKRAIDFVEDSIPHYRRMWEKVGETSVEVDPVVMTRMDDGSAEAVN